MANETIIKMIDTYINQLTEIKQDLSKLEDYISNNNSNEELAHSIFKLLRYKTREDTIKILKDVHYFTQTTAYFTNKSKDNDSSLADVDISEFEELLLSSGYSLIKESYGTDKDKQKIKILRNNGTYALLLKFDEYNNLCEIDVNTV